MRNYILFLTFALASLSTQAQTIVDMTLVQNAPFEVSTNEVSVVFDGSALTLGADVVVSGGQGPFAYAWLIDGKTYSVEPTFTVDKAGEYQLDIIDVCDCRQTVIFHVTAAEGIDALRADAPLARYSDGVITFAPDAPIVQATLVAANGRLMRVCNNYDNSLRTMSLYGMMPGQYILTMRLNTNSPSSEGPGEFSEVKTLKFIK